MHGGFADAAFYTAYALELVAAVVVIASIVSFFVISLAERRREISTLRCIGATRGQLLRIHLWESGLIGLFGTALGCAGGLLLARRLVKDTIRAGGGMLLDFVFPWPMLGIVSAVAVVVCVVAALAPVAWVLRSDVLRAGIDLDE